MRNHRISVLQTQSGMKSLLLILIALSWCIGLAHGIMVSTATAQDSKPVAVINGDSHVSVRQTVYLDGTMSSDPEKRELNYQWTLVSSPEGSSAVLRDDANSQTKFEADAIGIFKVKLVVNNGLVDSDPSYYTITVTK